jgi:isopenicillin-N N-acyltransferase-like protein
MKEVVSRRRFLRSGSCAAVGLLGGSLMGGCKSKVARPVPHEEVLPAQPPVEGSAPLAETTYVEGSLGTFPYLEVSGTPREIGQGIGKRFGGLIRKGIDRRAEWFKGLRDYAAGGGKNALATFEQAARKHTPRAFAELEGWSQGSGIELFDLMVLNHKSELAQLMVNDEREGAAAREDHPGCSTIVRVEPDRFMHLHNEDGHDAYADLMFVVSARLTDGIPYLGLSYPGILPGNAPCINASGVIQTTNFIGCTQVKLGVGRYFLDRMICEARNIDEALQWATHPERAYGYHHVLSSVGEKRVVSVEVTPSMKAVVDVEGLFIHTNHLVLEGMADEPQDEQYVSSSSMSRWNVLDAWKQGVEDPAALGLEDLVAPLSSHESKPYSPCRHPEGDIHGFTLATAVFDSAAGNMGIYKGQPCLGRKVEFDPPSMKG